MKLIIEPQSKEELYSELVDGLILPLENYSVGSIVYFSLDEIKDILNKNNY